MPKCTNAFFKRNLVSFLLVASGFLPVGTLFARDVESDTNDTFADSQVLSFQTDGVNGSLESSTFDPLSPDALTAVGRLEPGLVTTHLFSTGEPNSPFVAYIDNIIGTPSPDTTLQALDGDANTIDVDDDSSPLGNGLGSLVNGTTDDDGFVRLEVSGFSDFDFDGNNDGSGTAHPQTGPFEVYVQTGVLAIGDVDFYTITDLEPASLFEAEIVTGNTDTILAVIDARGSVVDTDDDGGQGLLSLITVVVPRSGVIHLAVTGFSDFGVTGDHSQSGDYSLDFRGTFVIPEPSAFAFILLGVGVVCAGRKRAS